MGKSESTGQHAQAAMQHALGSAAGLSGSMSHHAMPEKLNGNATATASTPFAVPRASFPQPHIHNVNNGPHVPTSHQQSSDLHATAGPLEPPLQPRQAQPKASRPQPQASVPPSLPSAATASVPATRPGKASPCMLAYHFLCFAETNAEPQNISSKAARSPSRWSKGTCARAFLALEKESETCGAWGPQLLSFATSWKAMEMQPY